MLTKNLLALNKTFFYLALLWTAIFSFLFLQSASSLPKVAVNNIDKIFHATFHFAFVIIWFLGFKIKNISNLKKVIIFSVFYGISIEILQKFLTTTRQPDILDVLANVFGAFIAFLVVLFWIKKYKILVTKKS